MEVQVSAEYSVLCKKTKTVLRIKKLFNSSYSTACLRYSPSAIPHLYFHPVQASAILHDQIGKRCKIGSCCIESICRILLRLRHLYLRRVSEARLHRTTTARPVIDVSSRPPPPPPSRSRRCDATRSLLTASGN